MITDEYLPAPDEELKLPPHSIEAEQGILGCILLSSSSALTLCRERLPAGPDSFYDSRHQTLYRIMLAMDDEGFAVDTLTLISELRDHGLLEESGGPQYLSSLPETVPSATNLEFYTAIVADKFNRRKLIAHCQKLIASALNDETQDAPVEKAIRELETFSAPGITPELYRMADLEESYAQHVKTIGSHGINLGKWLPTLGRLRTVIPGEMVVFLGATGIGKAQPLNASVATPTGFQPIGSIKPGHLVIGADGRPVRVNGIFPQGRKAVYRVILSDGTQTRCCAEHLWSTETWIDRHAKRNPGFTTKKTSDILSTIQHRDHRRNHALPLHQPVHFAGQWPTPLNPWLLGALIGDGKCGSGNVCFFKPETDLTSKVETLLPPGDTCLPVEGGLRIKLHKRSWRKSSNTAHALEQLGLRVHSEHKFIPRECLMAPIEDRLELLRGLMDTDGHVAGSSVEYSTSSEKLMHGVAFLARSLGYVVSRPKRRIPKYSHRGKKLEGLPSWRCHIHLRDGLPVPVSSIKHLSRIKTPKNKFHRAITAIEPDGEEECVCISVDATDGLYLTDDFIPTHNTAILSNIALLAAPMPTLFFQLELPKELLFERLLALRTKMPCWKIESSYASGDRQVPDFWPKAFPGLLLCTSARIDVADIDRRIKTAEVMGSKPIAVLVDYMGLLQGRGSSRYDRFSQIAEDLRLLAKSRNVILFIASQIGRKSADEGEEVRLTDGKESGSIENSASLVIGAWRDHQDTTLIHLKVLKGTKGGGGTCVDCNYNLDTLAITERSKYHTPDEG